VKEVWIWEKKKKKLELQLSDHDPMMGCGWDGSPSHDPSTKVYRPNMEKGPMEETFRLLDF